MKILFFATLLFSSNLIYGQNVTADNSTNPLQYFEFLIEGFWETNTTRQTFEWGIGEKSVVSKLYFTNSDSLKLVGEITWFWHPGLNAIKGYGTSIEMEMDFFDYTTSFESPTRMVNTFSGYGGQFDGVQQLETLEFIGEDKYIWTYYNKEGLEFAAAYSITFLRKKS